VSATVTQTRPTLLMLSFVAVDIWILLVWGCRSYDRRQGANSSASDP
jgi:hypothetical protein